MIQLSDLFIWVAVCAIEAALVKRWWLSVSYDDPVIVLTCLVLSAGTAVTGTGLILRKRFRDGWSPLEPGEWLCIAVAVQRQYVVSPFVWPAVGDAVPLEFHGIFYAWNPWRWALFSLAHAIVLLFATAKLRRSWRWKVGLFTISIADFCRALFLAADALRRPLADRLWWDDWRLYVAMTSLVAALSVVDLIQRRHWSAFHWAGVVLWTFAMLTPARFEAGAPFY